MRFPRVCWRVQSLPASLRDAAGIVGAYRRNGTGQYVSVYRSKAQGFDTDARYSVVCEEHGAILDASSREFAGSQAKCSEEWCDQCRALAEGGEL